MGYNLKPGIEMRWAWLLGLNGGGELLGKQSFLVGEGTLPI